MDHEIINKKKLKPNHNILNDLIREGLKNPEAVKD